VPTLQVPGAPAPAPVPARHQVSARVMGTDVDVIVVGDRPDPMAVVERLQDLEQRWSRFVSDSELSRLGRVTGNTAVVSTETAMLIERSLYAARRSGGRFDPTVLPALVAAGYDRDFDDLPAAPEPARPGTATPGQDSRPRSAPSAPTPVPGTDGITVDVSTGLVVLPAGVHLDAGGIGKGLAADLAAVEAVDGGADAVLVSVGGDLRVAGAAPAEGWEIEVDHHCGPPARVNLRAGALATSSTLRRRWAVPSADGGPGGVAHHVIDPRTGRPADGPAVSVSVLAPEAWWAEVLATTVLVGFGQHDLDRELPGLLDGAGCLVTTADGARHKLGSLGHAFDLADGSFRITGSDPMTSVEEI
jgi:FAD:protein FMN transferase